MIVGDARSTRPNSVPFIKAEKALVAAISLGRIETSPRWFEEVGVDST
jgi:hypothetical protein